MPLPWKKAKVTRISRIVADLQSPKRGGSLVVQTGFPTSLIDLFVKNRDRLKKPSTKKKKKKKTSCDNESAQVDVRVSDPIRASSESGSDNWSVRVGPICQEGEEANNSTAEIEESVESIGSSECDLVTRDENRVEEDSVGGGILLAVLKVFLVVVLALSTKKLVVGITLSAFLLLFIEYVSKKSVPFLRPCPEMEVRLKSMIASFSGLIWFKKNEILPEEENCVVEPELVDGSESNSIIEEIEIFEPKEEFLSTRAEVESLSSSEKKKENEAMEDGGDKVLVLEKCKSSKRAMIRAKIIKKFVPKKLRNAKKSKKMSKETNNVEVETQSSSDVSCYYELEEQEEEQEDPRSESRKEGVNDEISSLGEGLESGMELPMVSEDGREERKGNWVYLTLFLIALAGLLGGRILALLLTISWCFTLKLIGTRGRLLNLRMARSSFAISS